MTFESEEILCQKKIFFAEIPVNNKNSCKMKMQRDIAEKNISDEYVIYILSTCVFALLQINITALFLVFPIIP